MEQKRAITDVGIGPVVSVVAICGHCGNETKRQFYGFHGCDTCDSWSTDVRYERRRLIAENVV